MALSKKSVTCNLNLRLIVLLLLSPVCSSGAEAQQARSKAAGPPECLVKALTQFIGDAAFAAELKRNVSASPHEAIVAGERNGRSVVLVARRMPVQLDSRQRRELVHQKAVAELFKMRAGKSAPVEEALKAFQFPELLGNFGRQRLLDTVKGRLAAGAPPPDYLDCDDCVAVVLRVPNTDVSLEFVRLVSDQETRVSYVSSLMRAARSGIQTGDPQTAGKYLAEAGRLGYRSKGFFICLYKCQARAGNQVEAEKTARVIREQFAAGLGFDDCLELGEVADTMRFTSQAAIWNRLADSIIRGALAVPDLSLEK